LQKELIEENLLLKAKIFCFWHLWVFCSQIYRASVQNVLILAMIIVQILVLVLVSLPVQGLVVMNAEVIVRRLV
jgi:hypothetical protein